jgi:WD40 repeat protein
MNKALLTILIIFFVGSSLCRAQPEKYPFQRGDGDLISGLSWSPRNDLILTAFGDENGLRLWNLTTVRLLWLLRQSKFLVQPIHHHQAAPVMLGQISFGNLLFDPKPGPI